PLSHEVPPEVSLRVLPVGKDGIVMRADVIRQRLEVQRRTLVPDERLIRLVNRHETKPVLRVQPFREVALPVPRPAVDQQNDPADGGAHDSAPVRRTWMFPWLTRSRTEPS